MFELKLRNLEHPKFKPALLILVPSSLFLVVAPFLLVVAPSPCYERNIYIYVGEDTIRHAVKKIVTLNYSELLGRKKGKN